MTPTLDYTVLHNLRIYQSSTIPNLVNTLILLYLEQSPDLLHDIQCGLMIDDDPALLDATHRLRVSSIIIGGMALSSLCEEFEQCWDVHDRVTMIKLLEQMNTEYEHLAEALTPLLTV